MILLIICILILFLILVAVHTIDSRVLCFIFLGVVLILRPSYGFMLRYIYIMLMLPWYNCTEINIVKYRQSIAFSSIYIDDHFSWLSWWKATKDLRKSHMSPLSSELHAVFSGRQHQRCPHHCLGQGTGVTLSLENAPTSVCSLPRTMDRSNAKLGEGIKRLFQGLLAVLRIGRHSMQWKC